MGQLTNFLSCDASGRAMQIWSKTFCAPFNQNTLPLLSFAVMMQMITMFQELLANIKQKISLHANGKPFTGGFNQPARTLDQQALTFYVVLACH